jgi:O-methyltransferase
MAKTIQAYRPMKFPPYGRQTSLLLERYDDSVRYSTLALALHRIDSDSIPGAIAEVGVFRGMTSAFIRQVSEPSRKLYLFDTFEGFPGSDLEGRSDSRFKNTSVEAVLKRIGDTRGVDIRKGYFPDTAAGLEDERFSLVMLDVDLYATSLATLGFFYSRLAPGGYFFMHDYNSIESDHGVSRAANEFMLDKPELIIEIPDICGTAMFRKLRLKR